MKISEETFDVLKNFSTVNPSIAIKEGNVIRTISEQKNILAQAVVNESMPVDYAIYDLNQFLGLASLFEEPDFAFGESDVTIRDNNTRSRYTFTDPAMITSPPEKNIELDSPEIDFQMPYSSLKSVINGANQLGLPEIAVRGGAGIISLVATNTKNPTTNEFSVDVGQTNANFQMIFKTENLKFMALDYSVKISSKGVSQFTNETKSIDYWVATEAGSEYNG